jgi:hypothetical protein
MMQLSESVENTFELSQRALSLITSLSKPIEEYWKALYARSPQEGGPPDFADFCLKLTTRLRSLQRELLVAAVVDQMEPGPMPRQLVLDCQRRFNISFDHLRNLLMLSGYEEEADDLHSRRTYFRRIRGPRPGQLLREKPSIPRLLQKIIGIEPGAMIEAQLGLQAIAGFPGRPTSPQQQRRKKRRRRRANPGAPTASCRPGRDDDDEEE